MEISPTTRQNIFDILRIRQTHWSGRLDETKFLARIFDLQNMESYDYRFQDAEGDIYQHRINNNDWSEDWVFTDNRFDLMDGPDEIFLKFLCEMIHPIVRPDTTEVNELVETFNENLEGDGWELYVSTQISGKPIFSSRPLLSRAEHAMASARLVKEKINTSYIHRQIERLEKSIQTDPELAIGTAKEFLETICKTILSERGAEAIDGDDLPGLVRATLKELKLAADDIPENAKAVKTIRMMLMNLATISNALAELRNPYGTGHGKSAKAKGLEPRHARLAVGAATTLAVFLFETHTERKPQT